MNLEGPGGEQPPGPFALNGIDRWYSQMMSSPAGPLAVERQFFDALMSSSLKQLDEILSDDFLLIDVMSGSEIGKPALLDVLKSGQLKFESITQFDTRLRVYDKTAVVTGRTEMKGRFGEAPFSASSRYTHVYVQQKDRWRLVSAQGTQISPD